MKNSSLIFISIRRIKTAKKGKALLALPTDKIELIAKLTRQKIA
jgi:hypothetical protein